MKRGITIILMLVLCAGLVSARMIFIGRPRSTATSYWTDTNSPSLLLLMETTNAIPQFIDTSIATNHFTRAGGQTQGIAGTNQYGRTEYCVNFDGTYDSRLFSVSETTGLTATNDFTLIAYARFARAEPTNTEVIFARYLSATYNGRWGVWRGEATPWAVDCFLGDDASSQATVRLGMGSPGATNWHGYVVERLGKTFNVYVDGVLTDTRTDADVRQLLATTNTIGMTGLPTYQMCGDIDNVIIYAKALGSNAIYEATWKYFPTNSLAAR